MQPDDLEKESGSSDADVADDVTDNQQVAERPLVGQLIHLLSRLCQQYSALENKLDQEICHQTSQLIVGQNVCCHCFGMTMYGSCLLMKRIGRLSMAKKPNNYVAKSSLPVTMEEIKAFLPGWYQWKFCFIRTDINSTRTRNKHR